jgi:RimJ/RimL family protein N-acetyltransferase
VGGTSIQASHALARGKAGYMTEVKGMATKEGILGLLPLRQDDLTIREWIRQDVDLLAGWPAYPFPYEGLEFSFAEMSATERDERFRARQETPNTIVLVVDHANQPAIGYIAPRLIDWGNGTVGNFGFRIHPAWCGRGVGTSVLQQVIRWSFECGIKLWRLDVAASNARAIRCYEKVGFVRTGEIWRDASNLSDVDMNGPGYDFIRPHIRKQGGEVELCFWVMELRSELTL